MWSVVVIRLVSYDAVLEPQWLTFLIRVTSFRIARSRQGFRSTAIMPSTMWLAGSSIRSTTNSRSWARIPRHPPPLGARNTPSCRRGRVAAVLLGRAPRCLEPSLPLWVGQAPGWWRLAASAAWNHRRADQKQDNDQPGRYHAGLGRSGPEPAGSAGRPYAAAHRCADPSDDRSRYPAGQRAGTCHDRRVRVRRGRGTSRAAFSPPPLTEVCRPVGLVVLGRLHLRNAGGAMPSPAQ
jgi:hypothetical protein